MSPKKIRTRNVSAAEAEAYLNKAKEFYLSMIDEHRAWRWNAAGLAGVHCAISASDAVLGKVANLRSAGESHHEVIAVLKEYLHRAAYEESLQEQIKRFSRILTQKNLIEYEG